MNQESPEKTPLPPRKFRNPYAAELTEAQRASLVERRIQEAMREGAFDNLPGAGKPLVLDEPPPGASDLWWALRVLKQAGFVTDEVRYRQQIDSLQARLYQARTESDVRAIVREMNGWIVKLNTMGTNRIPTHLAPLDEEREVAALLARREERKG